MFNALQPYLPWLTTTALSLLLIFSSHNPQIEHLRGRTADLVAAVSFPLSSGMKGVRIWKENRHLRSLLARMSLVIATQKETTRENQRLRSMLEFRKKSNFKLLAGEVIGINPDPGINGLLINIGAKDGVTKNQPVIGIDGVAGRIYRVGTRSSTVQLLTDPNIGIAGIMMKSRENGIVYSASRGDLIMKGVPVTSKIDLGDTIVTSGLGGIFPPGLVIGAAKQIKPAGDGWLWEIIIEPRVDFARLEEVFVIQGSPDDH